MNNQNTNSEAASRSTLGVTIVELQGLGSESFAGTNITELSQIVMNHSLGASIASMGSAWVTGAGPAIATTLSTGFAFSMFYRINEKLGIKLSKAETKKMANSILHTVVPTITTPLISATLLSFIPILGNAASFLIMSGVCYSVTFTAGVVYLKMLSEMSKRDGSKQDYSADELEKVADAIIHELDLDEIVQEAQKIYAEEKEKGIIESPVQVIDEDTEQK
jgi:uncharacterized protein (DUF697 family)